MRMNCRRTMILHKNTQSQDDYDDIFLILQVAVAILYKHGTTSKINNDTRV